MKVRSFLPIEEEIRDGGAAMMAYRTCTTDIHPIKELSVAALLRIGHDGDGDDLNT